MLDVSDPNLSIRSQCNILSINRSSLYYNASPIPESEYHCMNLIDEIYTRYPFYGYRRITSHLKYYHDLRINKKKIQRLMQNMGLRSVCPGPHTSKGNKLHPKYPYLLQNILVTRSNQVWATDITYIRMNKGFMYLVAIIDWYSRYVLSWQLSNSLDNTFCIEALQHALSCYTHPDIFNSDQGSQFTSSDFTDILFDNNIKISMDGKGRYLDNIFVERLWRSLKYEEVYIREYTDGVEARESIGKYFDFYNNLRLHQALEEKTPAYWYYK